MLLSASRDEEMSHGPKLEQSWPGQTQGSMSVVLPHGIIQCSPCLDLQAGVLPAKRKQNLSDLSIKKPYSQLEMAFCSPGASLKSQVSILYQSGYQNYGQVALSLVEDV